MESVLQFIESVLGWPADHFWATSADVGGYALWDMTHFIMIGAAVLAALLFGALYMLLRHRGRKVLQIVFTALGFVVVLAYQAELIFVTHTWTVSDLPLGICGLTLFICLLNTVWENGFCTEWLFAAALPAALLSLCFPSWCALPVWSCAHLCRYLLPTIVIIYAVMILFGGNCPSVKRLPAVAFTLLALGVALYFVNPILETNFWGLTTRPAGQPWSLFAQLFGSEWYVLGLPSAAYALWFVIYLPLTLIAKAVNKNSYKRRLQKDIEWPDLSDYKPAESEEPATASVPATPAVTEISMEETPIEAAPAAEQPAAEESVPEAAAEETVVSEEPAPVEPTAETEPAAEEAPAQTEENAAQAPAAAAEEPAPAPETAAAPQETPAPVAAENPVEMPEEAPVEAVQPAVSAAEPEAPADAVQPATAE